MILQERRDFRLGRYNNNRPRKDFAGQSGSANTQVVNAVFREPVQQVLEKIKNELFFKWPNKMAGNPMSPTRAFIANIIRTKGTLQKTAGICGTIWTS